MSQQIVISVDENCILPSMEEYILLENQYTCNSSLDESKIIRISDPLKDKTDYITAINYIDDLTNRVMVSMYKKLNYIHGVEFCDRGWDFIVGAMLNQLLFSMYFKWLKIDKINTNGDVIFTYYQNDGLCTPQLSPRMLVWDLNMNNDLNSKLYRDILIWRSMGTEVKLPIVKVKSDFSDETKSERLARRLRNMFLEKDKRNEYIHKLQKLMQHELIQLMSNKSKSDVIPNDKNKICKCETLVIQYTIPEEIMNYVVHRSKGKVDVLELEYLKGIDNSFRRSKEIDIDSRKACLDDFKPLNLFEKCVKEMLVRWLPTAIFEDFNQVYSVAKDICSRYFCDKIYTDGRFPFDNGATVGNVMMALMLQRNVKLVSIQHSFLYSVSETCRKYEDWLYDEFLSWGFSVSEKKNVRPIAGTRFSHLIRQPLININSINRILYIGSSFCHYETGADIHGNYTEDLEGKRRIFLENIHSDIFRKIIFRGRGERSIRVGNRILPYESYNSCSLADSINKSDVIICEQLSSSYLEALLSGKPTFLFDGSVPKILLAEIENWLAVFKELEMYVSDGGELASLLNEKMDIICSNWDSEIREMNIEKFIDILHHTEASQQEVWLKEFCG